MKNYVECAPATYVSPVSGVVQEEEEEPILLRIRILRMLPSITSHIPVVLHTREGKINDAELISSAFFRLD